MTGTIVRALNVRALNTMPAAIVKGDDGVEYFLHKNDYERGDKFTYNDRVEFDVRDDGKKRPCAVNALFIGCGDRHPFCTILKLAIEYIEFNVCDCTEKQCRLRDMKFMHDFIEHSRCTAQDLRDIAETQAEYRRNHPIVVD